MRHFYQRQRRLRRRHVAVEPLARRSQAEVAMLLGISQMRVSQIERSAIAKLRAFFYKGAQ